MHLCSPHLVKQWLWQLCSHFFGDIFLEIYVAEHFSMQYKLIPRECILHVLYCSSVLFIFHFFIVLFKDSSKNFQIFLEADSSVNALIRRLKNAQVCSNVYEIKCIWTFKSILAYLSNITASFNTSLNATL